MKDKDQKVKLHCTYSRLSNVIKICAAICPEVALYFLRKVRSLFKLRFKLIQRILDIRERLR